MDIFGNGMFILFGLFMAGLVAALVAHPDGAHDLGGVERVAILLVWVCLVFPVTENRDWILKSIELDVRPNFHLLPFAYYWLVAGIMAIVALFFVPLTFGFVRLLGRIRFLRLTFRLR